MFSAGTAAITENLTVTTTDWLGVWVKHLFRVSII